jgi:acetyl esterase/lipase
MRRLYNGGAISGAAGITLLLTSLAGCMPVDFLNATISTRDIVIDRDIAYGGDPRQKLDVYSLKTRPQNAPVIVFFYGGAWQSGDKNDYLFVAQALAKQGWVVVLPNYRVYPQVTFPVFLEDGASAVAWVGQNIEKWGGDTRSIFTMGHSAGGYIAIMLALNPHYLAEAGVPGLHLAGGMGLSGPYDFLPIIRQDIKAIFEVVPDVTVTQPIRYAHAGAPPVLLLTGDADETVEPYNTEHLANRIRALGGHVEDHIYPGVGHTGSVLALTSLFRDRAPVLADIQKFVLENTRDPAAAR